MSKVIKFMLEMTEELAELRDEFANAVKDGEQVYYVTIAQIRWMDDDEVVIVAKNVDLTTGRAIQKAIGENPEGKTLNRCMKCRSLLYLDMDGKLSCRKCNKVLG